MLQKMKVSVSLSKMADAGAQVHGTKTKVFRKNNNDIFLSISRIIFSLWRVC